MKSFNVHRVILASASKYFCDIFEGDTTTNEISLKIDHKTFEDILSVVYTGHAIVDVADVRILV